MIRYNNYNNKTYKGGGFYKRTKYKSNPFYSNGGGIITDFIIDEGKRILKQEGERLVRKGAEKLVKKIKKDPTVNQVLNKWTGNGIKRI